MDSKEVKVYSMNASILIKDTLCALAVYVLLWKNSYGRNKGSGYTIERRTARNHTNECGVVYSKQK